MREAASEQDLEEWVRLGEERDILSTKNTQHKDHMESTQEKPRVAWLGDRGQRANGGGSRKKRTSKKTGEVGQEQLMDDLA